MLGAVFVTLLVILSDASCLAPPKALKCGRKFSLVMEAHRPGREDSKSSLLREIKAQSNSSGRNAMWKRVQYPSPESLVKRYASQLEEAQVSGEDGMNAIDFGAGAWDDIIGDWTLVYTNNVASSPTTSISLPPPPFSEKSEDIEVFQLDSVIQRISRDGFNVGADIYRHLQVDHILRFKLALPRLPTSLGAGFLREQALQGEVVLEHDVKVVSENSPAKLAIDLRDIKVLVEDDKGIMRDTDTTDSSDPLAEGLKSLLRSIAGLTGGGSSSASDSDLGKHGNAAFLTMLSVPLTRLLGPSYLRRGYFEVTYVDEDLRISRGPFGELRVFSRAESDIRKPAATATSDNDDIESKSRVLHTSEEDLASALGSEKENTEGDLEDAPSDVESGK